MGKPKETRTKPEERIVKAGRKLFFKLGFSKVSTDALAKEAAVSKNTMYKYYGDMAGVLRAVMEVESANFTAGLHWQPETREGLEKALVGYGKKLLAFLNGRDVIRFTQLMHEEARTHRDIAQDFFESAYMRSQGTLADLLDHASQKGLIQSELSSAELAEMLLGMWETIRMTKAALGLTKKPFADPADWAEKCVRKLLSDC